MSRIGEVVRSARLARGLTQERLAELIGHKQHYVSMIERGRIQRPGYDVLVRLADALAVPVGELLRATGVEVIADGAVMVPVMGLVPGAGARLSADRGEAMYRVQVVADDLRDARAPYGLEVEGDDLRSLGIYAGDVVIVDPADGRPPANGRLAVVRLDDRLVLARWCADDGLVTLRDGADAIIWSGPARDVEVVAHYLTFRPLGPR